MKLFKIKNFAAIGAMSIAGVGLVGVGAHAVYTSTAGDTQTINAGTLAISATSTDGGSCAAYDGNGNCGSWTLPDVSGVNSTFNSGNFTVTFTNNGTVAGWYNSQSATVIATAPDNFSNDAWVCIYQTGLDGHYSGPLYDGVISGAPAAYPAGFSVASSGYAGESATPLEYAIQPASADSYTVQFYAGGAGTGPDCTGVAPQLTSVDEGGGATLTITNVFDDTPVS
jgi:hypothetical protein